MNRPEFWTLRAEEVNWGMAPRARLGYLEVFVTDASTDCRKNSFTARTELKWNKLPEEVKRAQAPQIFRRRYRAWRNLPQQEEHLEHHMHQKKTTGPHQRRRPCSTTWSRK